MFKVPESATSVILVQGLPADTSAREVAHIFRPYLGYKRIRMEFKNSQADLVYQAASLQRTLVCYAEFETSEQATTVINTIQVSLLTKTQNHL